MSTKKSDSTSIMGRPQASESGTHAIVQGLKNMGYQQELTRSRGSFQTLSMLIAMFAVPFVMASTLTTALIGGGPVPSFWGWVLTSIATQPIAWSLAEISSKYPTSGGTYYWCFRLTSPQHRKLASWINGWITMVGMWLTCLTVTVAVIQILVAGINIFHPAWALSPWQGYLMIVGFTLFANFIGIFYNNLLPTIDIICACWTLLGVIGIMVCVSAKAGTGRHSVAFAFGHFDPSLSGWPSGWSFFIGMLPAAYVYIIIGMVTNMAEEIHDPAVQLPLAVSWIAPISLVIGIVFILPILFTLPDLKTLFSAPGFQPTGVLFQRIMGSKGGGFGLWLIVFGSGIFSLISISCATSRATWAFARDQGIPLHRVWSKVNQRLGGAPVNAYMLSVLVQILVPLIKFGSVPAFISIISAPVTFLGASYAMPILISLVNGRKDVKDAPFGLGKWGWPLNVFAVLWTLFEMVLFSAPAMSPVTKDSMNYSSVVFVGTIMVSAAWYLIRGRNTYKGPPNPREESTTK